MDIVKIKNGQEVLLREIEKSDAQGLIDFYNVVGGESDFLSFGENEFSATLKSEEEFIENMRKDLNCKFILAFKDDRIVAAASITSNQKRKMKHIGTLGIVVKKEMCNSGIGKIMIENLVNWSKSNGINTKITLVTRCDNTNAIELYKKIGFEIEGILKNDNFDNNKYYDTLSMGLILDK